MKKLLRTGMLFASIVIAQCIMAQSGPQVTGVKADDVWNIVYKVLNENNLALSKNGAAKPETGARRPVAAASVSGNGASVSEPAKPQESAALIMSTFHNSEDAPPCTSCGSSMMVRQAGCYVCLNCGAQGGCG